MAAPQPRIDVGRPQDRYHRLRVDRRDQLVRIAGDHREAAALGRLLPEPGHGERRLVSDLKPYLTFQRRLAVAQVVLVRRPFADLSLDCLCPIGCAQVPWITVVSVDVPRPAGVLDVTELRGAFAIA